MVAAALTIWLYIWLVNPVAIAAWFAALLGGLFYASRSDKSLSDSETRNISNAEFRQQNVSVSLLA